MSRRGSGLYARSHTLFSVAAAAAAPSASPTSVPPPPGWRTLPIHSWQARRFLAEDASPLATSLWATRVKAGNGNDASAAEHRVHLLGARLGPRPLVFIPSFGPLAGYEAALAAAQHKDGVVALSYQFATPAVAAAAIRESRARRTTAAASVLAGLSVPPAHLGLDYDNDGFISDYCHSLAAVLHCLDAAWVHVVGHSVGGLVAAKMALLYPRLVGTVTLIDTPLATRFDVDSDQQRETIHSARVDVNVPRKAVDEAVAQLKLRTLGPKPEPLLASPTETDATVYAALFDRNETFSADATARDAAAWLSVQHLRMLRQPVHTILPPKATPAAEGGAAAQGANKKKAAAAAAVAAAAASDPAEDMTRELVPVRKATHMKAGHPTAPETAAELGQALSAWIARFDADAVIARTWTRAKDEVSKAKPAATEGQAAAAGTTAPAAAGAKGGDKKGKKGNAPANKKP